MERTQSIPNLQLSQKGMSKSSDSISSSLNKYVNLVKASSSFESRECMKCRFMYYKNGNKKICKCLRKEFSDIIAREESLSPPIRRNTVIGLHRSKTT